MYDDGWFGLSYSFLDCHADTEEIKIIKIHQFYEKTFKGRACVATPLDPCCNLLGILW